MACVCAWVGVQAHVGEVCPCVFVHMRILGLSVEISMFTQCQRHEPFSTHILRTSTRLPTKFCSSLHSRSQGNLMTSMQDEAERFAQEIPSKQPGRQRIEITRRGFPAVGSWEWQRSSTSSSCLLRVCRNTTRTGKRRTACSIKREGSCWNLLWEWQSENMLCGPKQSGGNREIQMGL